MTRSANGALVEVQRPALEELDDVGAGAELRDEIGDRGLDQDVDELREGFGLLQSEEPGRGLVGRAAAADHVGRHRPGRAAEADQGLVWAAALPCTRASVSSTGSSCPSTCSGFSARRGRAVRAPDPRRSRSAPSWPSASGMTRMSEKRIAASRSNRRSGCSVTSAASVGRVAELEEAPDRLADRAVLGQVAAGLPHDPDRGTLLALAEHRPQQRLCHGLRPHSRVQKEESRFFIIIIMAVFCPNSRRAATRRKNPQLFGRARIRPVRQESQAVGKAGSPKVNKWLPDCSQCIKVEQA